MSLFGMIAVLAIILFLSGLAKNPKKADEKNQSDKIVGHTSAMEEKPTQQPRKTRTAPMATPTMPKLNPVFLKEEDWSEYDKPTFARMKKSDSEVARLPAPSKSPAQQTRKKSPKQSMAEFQAKKRPVDSCNTAKKGSYEEI